jgi:hypothetical protein
MRAHPTGRKKNARRLRTRALWLGLLAGLFAISIAARPEMRSVLAQSSSPPAASSQQAASPAQDTAAQPGAVEPAVKQDSQAPPPADPPRHQVTDDSARLLKLANRLKAEVDSTTMDTLSITAIRDAQEIEKLAHKMRTK